MRRDVVGRDVMKRDMMKRDVVGRDWFTPHPSSLVFDPGPTRCIAPGVRRLKCAQAHFSKPRLTPHP